MGQINISAIFIYKIAKFMETLLKKKVSVFFLYTKMPELIKKNIPEFFFI